MSLYRTPSAVVDIWVYFNTEDHGKKRAHPYSQGRRNASLQRSLEGRKKLLSPF